MGKEKYVYIIRGDTGPVKIGFATSPASRRTEIQSGSFMKLSVIYSLPVPASDAPLVERTAHEVLSKHRMAGEWFDVSMEIAQSTILAAAAEVARKRGEGERLQAIEDAERARLAEERLAAERASILQVPNVELVRRVTSKEYQAEKKKMEWEQNAPRREFVQRMVAGKRAKAAARREEEERLAQDAEKLRAYFGRR